MPRGDIVKRGRVSALPVMPLRDAVHFPGVTHAVHVAREGSLLALAKALEGDRMLLAVSQRDMQVEDPTVQDLYRVGTISLVTQAAPLPDGSMRVVLKGLDRGTAVRFSTVKGVIRAVCEQQSADKLPNTLIEEAASRECILLLRELITNGQPIPMEAVHQAEASASPGLAADAIAHQLLVKASVKQGLLEEFDDAVRLQRLHSILSQETEILRTQNEMRARVNRDFDATQREFFLREQLRAIQSELGHDPWSAEIEFLRRTAELAALPTLVQERVLLEIDKLARLANSPEGGPARAYIDFLLSLPWMALSKERLDTKRAAKALDACHAGLDQAKERILEFLAVRQITRSLRGPVLCFVGPPGVGKTSIGRSIANSLGREFVRVSLGGVRDEAEIRGHRRTYLGAMSGKIIDGLKRAKTRNPVMMLDEIDKMSGDLRGDPASALLEVLDPSQNIGFVDHYVDLPFDLSDVFFVATANRDDRIPSPLLDRMEIIPFPSYTEPERIQIAERFLIKDQMEEHGLAKRDLSFDRSAIEELCRNYAREAGVRQLSREIANICRKVARKKLEPNWRPVRLAKSEVAKFLGPPLPVSFSSDSVSLVGVASGLVLTEYGGEVLSLECLLLPDRAATGSVRLTGNLGQVMQESAQTAVSLVRGNGAFAVPCDIHIHALQAAVPKDGPSAGLPIAAALFSAALDRPVSQQVALTGEISLRGRVLPVGGICDKALAAQRAGVKEVIFPEANLPELLQISDALADIKLSPVKSVDQAMRLIFKADSILRGAGRRQREHTV